MIQTDSNACRNQARDRRHLLSRPRLQCARQSFPAVKRLHDSTHTRIRDPCDRDHFCVHPWDRVGRVLVSNQHSISCSLIHHQGYDSSDLVRIPIQEAQWRYVSSNFLFVAHTNGKLSRFPPGEEDMIPSYHPLERQLVRSFLSKRLIANLNSTHSDLDRWFSADCIHYRSDSGEGIEPVVFEYTDEELYDSERADDYWAAKGCKWPSTTNLVESIILTVEEIRTQVDTPKCERGFRYRRQLMIAKLSAFGSWLGVCFGCCCEVAKIKKTCGIQVQLPRARNWCS